MNITFYGLLLFCLFSCNSVGVEGFNKNKSNLSFNKLIDKQGKYVSLELNTILNIEIKNDIVVYSITDTSERLLYNSTAPNASAFQNWFFSIDKYGDIWFYSSDIGLFKMKRLSDKFERNIYKLDSKDSLELPKCVYEKLPSSLKKRIHLLQFN